jgi:protein TonB
VVGLATQKAKLLNAPHPVYPPLAKSAKVQGVCRFNVLVSQSGAVSDVKLVRGHPLLVNAAKEAVRQYRYQKTVIDGVEKKVWTMVDVNFDLSR